MSEDYSPTTEEVRTDYMPAAWEFGLDPRTCDPEEFFAVRDAAFDRWLAAHDRRVAEELRSGEPSRRRTSRRVK